MTYKEALEQLKYEIEEEGHCSYIEDEMKVAFEALEKQIPKKPTPKEKYNSGYAMHCPSCKTYIRLEPNKRDIFPANIANAYCQRCGQALDWSDSE